MMNNERSFGKNIRKCRLFKIMLKIILFLVLALHLGEGSLLGHHLSPLLHPLPCIPCEKCVEEYLHKYGFTHEDMAFFAELHHTHGLKWLFKLGLQGRDWLLGLLKEPPHILKNMVLSKSYHYPSHRHHRHLGIGAKNLFKKLGYRRDYFSDPSMHSHYDPNYWFGLRYHHVPYYHYGPGYYHYRPIFPYFHHGPHHFKHGHGFSGHHSVGLHGGGHHHHSGGVSHSLVSHEIEHDSGHHADIEHSGHHLTPHHGIHGGVEIHGINHGVEHDHGESHGEHGAGHHGLLSELKNIGHSLLHGHGRLRGGLGGGIL